MSIPKKGTLERIVFDKLVSNQDGVTYMDFVGTGVTEENIESIINNLRNAMYEAEDDDQIKFDS